MKKALLIFSSLIALGLVGWGVKAKFFKKQRTTYVRVKVKTGTIEDTVDATGAVSPMNRVEIKPNISGRIEKLLVDEGDHVKQGQIIAWMSSTDRAAILDGARAEGPKALKKWEDTYKATPIVAPLPGLIILNNVVEGQMVDPTVVIYAMSDYLIVLAQVDESDIGRVRIGMPARVTLDAYPDKSLEGKVFDILYEGKNVSNVIQYGVKITFDKVPDYYRSQMTANISFILNKKNDAVLVPSATVKPGPDGYKLVMVPGPNGEPVTKTIKTGIESGDNIEVVEGLEAGDTILRSQGRYVPQEGPQSSPFTPGGRGPSGGGNTNRARGG